MRGYYRKNGTYVSPHYRRTPSSSRNNWSTVDNINSSSSSSVVPMYSFGEEKNTALRPPQSKYGNFVQPAETFSGIQQSGMPAPISVPSLSSTSRSNGNLYWNVGSSHWISENLDGRSIKLEDGSLWEISVHDRNKACLWLELSNIIIKAGNYPLYPYILTNTVDGEAVEAKLLNKGSESK